MKIIFILLLITLCIFYFDFISSLCNIKNFFQLSLEWLQPVFMCDLNGTISLLVLKLPVSVESFFNDDEKVKNCTIAELYEEMLNEYTYIVYT
jgi:hypothetical protein